MISEFKAEFVEFIPEKSNMELGVLYISESYKTVVHICPCGCNDQIATPIGAGGWTVTKSEDSVTLAPSAGNYQIPCRSHYYIRDNKVCWCEPPLTVIGISNEN